MTKEKGSCTYHCRRLAGACSRVDRTRSWCRCRSHGQVRCPCIGPGSGRTARSCGSCLWPCLVLGCNWFILRLELGYIPRPYLATHKLFEQAVCSEKGKKLYSPLFYFVGLVIIKQLLYPKISPYCLTLT